MWLIPDTKNHKDMQLHTWKYLAMKTPVDTINFALKFGGKKTCTSLDNIDVGKDV